MNNREQFEEWVDSNFPFKKDRFHIFRDEYKSQFTRQLWEAWQASRAAVEINLPTKNDISDEDRQIPDLSDWDDGRNSGIQECAEAIRAEGINVEYC